MLYPPFVWYRVIFLLEDACSAYNCLQMPALFGVRQPQNPRPPARAPPTGCTRLTEARIPVPWSADAAHDQNAELASCFWYLLTEGLVLYPLTWYIQQVLPNQFGVRRSPFFFLAPLLRMCRKPKEPAGA